MLAAVNAANPNISVPMAVLFGGALYFSVKAERQMPKIPIVLAVLFGASASSTILAIFTGIMSATGKG